METKYLGWISKRKNQVLAQIFILTCLKQQFFWPPVPSTYDRSILYTKNYAEVQISFFLDECFSAYKLLTTSLYQTLYKIFKIYV